MVHWRSDGSKENLPWLEVAFGAIYVPAPAVTVSVMSPDVTFCEFAISG